MKYVKVISAFTSVAGKLHLTDAQADARTAMLTPVKGEPNHFATRVPVGFKLDEVFGWDVAEIEKKERSSVEEVKIDFDKRIKDERAAAAVAKEKALAGRRPVAKKEPKGGLFGKGE